MPGPVSGREGLGELGAFAVWEELFDGKTQSIASLLRASGAAKLQSELALWWARSETS